MAVGKPDRQWRPGPVEDRASGYRGAVATASAHDPAIAQPPTPWMAALGTDEPLRPAQPMQVIQTSGISAEPGLKLTECPRVVHTAAGMFHPHRLLRLNGDAEGTL